MLLQFDHRGAIHRDGSSTGNAAVPFPQGELDRVYDGQDQPAPATPVHQGKEQSAMEGAGGDGDEEQRKAADREYGSLASEGRNQGFRAASVFDPTLFPNNGIGEGDGGEFDNPTTKA